MEENQKRHWIIYMYTFPNGKRYVGKTNRTLQQRQGQDFKRYKRCTLLWKAIQKYGVNNIEQTILFENDMENAYASRLEQICILLFKTNCNRFRNPTYGYNLTDGGEGVNGWHPDEKRYKELCEMIQQLNKKRRGVPLTEEHKQKLSQSHKGKSHNSLSEETRKKISIANSRENMSEETRIRRSNSKKKKVIATHKITGEQIIFDSMTEVAEYFHVALSSVNKWCNQHRSPQNDYIFRYLSTNND